MDNGGESQRWQGQRSSFSWEQGALEHIKAQMPLAEPYRAWQTFTFTANTGHVREVDLFIATPGGLFLVEIKSHPGIATNNGSTWLFRDGDVTRTIENPLHFTDQKAKELRAQLQRAAPRGLYIPFIGVGVLLSAETLKSRLDEFQAQRVYGRDGLEGQTGLEGIWHGLLSQPPRSERDRVTHTLSRQLPGLMQRIGIQRLHKAGKVGPYELAARSFGNGPSWEDYLATNPALPDDQPRRIRVYLSRQQATDDDKKSTQRAARREYLALQGISHDGIVRAEQYSDELITGPAVIFRHGQDWQRLDHFLVARAGQHKGDGSATIGLPVDTRIEMIRQLAEALDHAHRRHLYHRALAPRSVYVELDGHYPRLRIADWQVAARPHGPASSTTSGTGTMFGGSNALLRHVEPSAGPYLAPELNEPGAAAALLDVFGLGALSYLILTGQPPAQDRTQLAAKLSTERALIPSAVADSISPPMDDLVREATRVSLMDRTGSVREFLKKLDLIEQGLADPEDRPPAPDPLTAVKGDDVEGWTVVRALGKGTTSKALLVTRDGLARRVFKVALNDAAAERLKREAQQLAPLADSHVARLLDASFPAGPPGQRRWVIGIEYVDRTLQDELRTGGPLAWTINELERFGEDLFQALKFLEGRGIWHRDIKPENIGLRKLPRKGRELVLFDFSLAGTPDTELGVGTKGYLDPFLGSATRQRYDQAAELYAAAVTLHEMASGELPAWGDEIVPVGFLDDSAEVQLAEDVFDPVIRDGLVKFFKTALHRDAAQRHGSLRAMTRAWTDIFKEVKTDPPASTAATLDALSAEDDAADDEEAARAIAAKRDAAAASATPETVLVAAGLSPYALSIALRHLGVSTVGELAAVPTRRIIRMLGIGRDTRQELIRRSQEWRRNLDLAESESSYPGGAPAPGTERPRPAASRNLAAQAAPEAPAGPAEELAQLPLDEVARRLVPDSPPALRQVAGLDPAPTGGRVSPWASRQEASSELGLSAMEVATALDRLQARWAKSVPALRSIRDDVVKILREHGRIQGLDQLAVALLVRRGSGTEDPAQRLREAALCIRAAVEAEERLDSPRLRSQRRSVHPPGSRTPGKGLSASGVLVALTGAGDDGSVPRPEDLLAYAELLGEQADMLSAHDPLPSVSEIRQALRSVWDDEDNADHFPRLSDTDLVLLAAAASRNTAATARLELYPRDLDSERAMRISQAGSLLGRPDIAGSGVPDTEYVRRVRARFPDLANPPKVENIPELLRKLGYDAVRDDSGNLRIRATTLHSSSQAPARPKTKTTIHQEKVGHAHRRLAEASQRGGFVALKTTVPEAAPACAEIARVDGVHPVNVTTEFVRLLREVVQEQGRPRWEVVVEADSESASPAARDGFAALLDKAWDRLEAHVRAAGIGSTVFLHDATPLARYAGGNELLARLAVAARDAEESPRGLWLLCPMGDPDKPPSLDGMTVGVTPGDAEQFSVPDGFGTRREGTKGIVINPGALLADLKVQVRELEKDLRTNEDDIAKLRIEYDEAYTAHRTAADFETTWLPERVTQVAVAWVLGTVFVRFCEDNGLIADAFIAGPGERAAQARERQEAYFQVEANRHKTDRDWLREAFKQMSKSPVARGLFAEHNPMWSIAPSQYAAKALIQFWRRTRPEGETLVLIHNFVDAEWNTRFLGDLYQNLSEAARKTYALLQTPEFVEEFILKRTLDEAIKEFGLEPDPPYGHPDLLHRLRVIDPACGSGHFLLGAFHHLLEAWRAEHPGADSRTLVANALQSVHGVDKNPFAAAIARFRVMLAAMKVADVRRLDERVDFPLNIAVGDSLLHGAGAPGIQGELGDEGNEGHAYTYSTEDVTDFFKPPVEILSSGTYHAVVGNPPYITVKDPAENANYRAYPSCYGVYALSVPFAERMFQLAIPGGAERLGAGYVGQITANSFMKREFGKRLIQEYFPKVDLTHVIDTSGAYIPGHGTPTVILLGRRRVARPGATVRTVLGIRGEPSEPPHQLTATSGERSWTRSTTQAARASGLASPICRASNSPSTRGASVAGERRNWSLSSRRRQLACGRASRRLWAVVSG